MQVHEYALQTAYAVYVHQAHSCGVSAHDRSRARPPASCVLLVLNGCMHSVLRRSCMPADDENDAVLFEKIKKGEYDADDPIWDQVSLPAKDLVVSLT